MAPKFIITIQRVVPIGYHHLLIIFVAASIILLSLLLAGCSSSSPLIPGIFLISLYYQRYSPTYDTAQNNPQVFQQIASIVGNAQLEVRVGYFGICVSDGGDWLCSNNATALASSYNIDADPLNLIWVAKTFKDAVVFPYLLIVAVVLAFLCMILLATFPGWYVEEDPETGETMDVRPFPSRAVCQVALALIFVASIFVLISVLWQHTASVGAASITEDFGNGSVHSGVGTTAMVLGWFGFVLFLLVVFAVIALLIAMSALANAIDIEVN